MDDHARTCEWCQTTISAARNLRETKLGKHDRRQLLGAASPGNDPAPITPPGPSQADQTANRRAVAKLVKAGLIRLSPETRRFTPGDPDADLLLRALDRDYVVLRFAWRTPLGEEVVRRWEAELRENKRRRWQIGTRLDEAEAAALAACPHRKS